MGFQLTGLLGAPPNTSVCHVKRCPGDRDWWSFRSKAGIKENRTLNKLLGLKLKKAEMEPRQGCSGTVADTGYPGRKTQNHLRLQAPEWQKISTEKRCS